VEYEEDHRFSSAKKDGAAHTSLVRERRAGRSRTIRPGEGPLLPTNRGARGDLDWLEAERKWSVVVISGTDAGRERSIAPRPPVW